MDNAGTSVNSDVVVVNGCIPRQRRKRNKSSDLRKTLVSLLPRIVAFPHFLHEGR